MGWFRKKADPISERARALNDQIAHLEAQIKNLDGRLARQQTQPKLRSTAMPGAAAVPMLPPPDPPAPLATAARPSPDDPIFEDLDLGRLQARVDTPTTREHFNELGVRKYDLTALLRRIRNHFRGPSTTNPKLVSYLAAGGIQGLRPLRYEKRVARNRFLVLVIILFVILLGLLAAYVRRN